MDVATDILRWKKQLEQHREQAGMAVPSSPQKLQLLREMERIEGHIRRLREQLEV